MTNPFEDITVRLDRLERLILDSKISIRPVPPSDTWFDLSELCLYLPDKPAKPTIYAKVQGRIIPFHKKGKKLFFLKSEIDAWLKTGRRSTAVEIEAKADEYFTSNSR